MSKSIYSGSVSGRLIYGGRKVIPCCVTDLCLTGELTAAFNTLLGTVNVVITKLFPAVEIKSTLIAKMSAKACVAPPLFVRILWRRAHPDDPWEGTDAQILQLLDIYLENGWDWTGDKLFDANARCLPDELLPPPDTGDNPVTQSTRQIEMRKRIVARSEKNAKA